MTTLVWVFLVLSLFAGMFIGHKVTMWLLSSDIKNIRKENKKEIDELKKQLAKYDTGRPNSL